MQTTKLLDAATATGAGAKANGVSCEKTYQVSGRTSASTGAATVQVQGSNNGGVSWDTFWTFTLSLTASGGTSDASDSIQTNERYAEVRMNVSAISGTGAQVSGWRAY